MFNKISIVIALIVLAGCATGYKSDGIFTGGFTETRLQEDMFKINFKGNRYTNRERASDFAMLRCAELTIINGYKYFLIINEDEYDKKSTYVAPTRYKTTQTPSGGHRTQAYGGGVRNVSKPRATYVIKTFHEKPEDMPMAMDARYLMNSIREKYNIEPITVIK